MNRSHFIRDMGIGLMIGTAIGMNMSEKQKHCGKKGQHGKVAHMIGDVMDTVATALNG